VIRVAHETLNARFTEALRRVGFDAAPAERCAGVFADNSLDGIASHGWNRFPGFVRNVEDGIVDPHAQPTRLRAAGAWEQWEGHAGPGPLNAIACTDRAIELAESNGIGAVALRNTNHWMRAGAYGWRAASAGYAFMCWTNTIPNMPAWGSTEPVLGNNPFVLAMPGATPEEPVVLDMAMTQFAFGKLEVLSQSGEHLPVPGGYDDYGNLTSDPAAILASGRALPIGFWKGSGLSLMLDLFATVLSDGRSTSEIGRDGIERGVSQVYLAIDVGRAGMGRSAAEQVGRVFGELETRLGTEQFRYPGKGRLEARTVNLRDGIPIDEGTWAEIQELAGAQPPK
jgi:3-dehydro-L-gulonate 2-dehydrogenase